MRILMLTPQAPFPPNSGVRIRHWQQIRHLSRRHDLTVVAFMGTAEEYRSRHVLEEVCRRVIPVRPPGEELPAVMKDWPRAPWPLQLYASREMKDVLEKVTAEPFDAVLVEFIYMAQYRDLFPGPVVLIEHNIESNIFRQYAERPEIGGGALFGVEKGRPFWLATWRLMVEYENRMWARFPLRTTVSREDKAEMDRRCSAGRAVVVANGIDASQPPLPPCPGSQRILFMGTMNYHPNVDAARYLARTIMPLLWARDSGASLCIAGRDPLPEVSALAGDPRIEVCTNPADMRQVAADCRLTVVPLRLGGGTRGKILDSMAMGLPVVSTSLGCQGLAVTDGIDILVRDDPDAFAEAVSRLILDESLWEAVRHGGRRLAEECYDWQGIFQGLERELAALAGTAP